MKTLLSKSPMIRVVASALIALMTLPLGLLAPEPAAAAAPPVIQVPDWLSNNNGVYELHSLEGALINLQIQATGSTAPALTTNQSVGNLLAVPSANNNSNPHYLTFTTTSPDSTTTIATIAGQLDQDSNGTYQFQIIASTSDGVTTLPFLWYVSAVPAADVRVVLGPASGSPGDPVYFGDPVAVTATVSASGYPAISGDVTFVLGASGANPATPLTAATPVDQHGQVGPVLLTNLPVGQISIEAHYSGGSAANGQPMQAGIGAAVLGIGKIPTATTAQGNPNPALLGQTVTLIAQVTSPKLASVDQGTVDFLNESSGFAVLGSALVNSNGQATIQVATTNSPNPPANQLPLGSSIIRANYSGTSTIDFSNITFVQVVQLNPTVTTVTASPSNPSAGQPVTLTAHVTSSGNPVIVSTVMLADGANVLVGAVPLDATGNATYTTSTLAAGLHHITANFTGTANFDPSTGALDLTVNALPTTTVVTVSPSSPTVGDAVVFTAMVSNSGSPVTGGTVVLKENGIVLAGPVSVSGGVFTLGTSALATGLHNLTIEYSGTTVYGASSAALPLTVNAGTTTAVVASPAAATLGAAVVLTATVTSTATVAAGTVTFREGAMVVGGPFTLNASGQASVTTSGLSIGTHTITASYSGAAGYAASSGNATVSITAPLAGASAISASASPNPVTVGATVTFSASVLNGSGPITGGDVSITEGGLPIAAVTVVLQPDGSGSATLTGSFATAGSHLLMVSYSGSGSAGAASTPLTLFVNANTCVTATPSVSPAIAGTPVTFTAVVGCAGSTPTGSVVLKEAGTVIAGPGTLIGGQAALPVSFSTAGVHTLSVEYAGDTGFNPSTGALSIPVKAGTITVVATTPVAPVVGQTVTFIANILSGGQPLTAGGTVTITEGSLTVGPVTVDANGQAILSTSALTAGSHTLAVAYSGAGDYNPSGTSVSLTVSPAVSTTVTVSSSPNASLIGQPVNVVATVQVAGVPVTAGTVTFAEGATQLLAGVALNALGQASYMASSLSVGSHTITASYSGAPGYAPGTGSVVQVVNLPATAVSATFQPATPAETQTITFTATVLSGGSPVTTGGSVSILQGTGVIAGPVTLGSNGTATLTNSTLPAGVHTLTVSYAGNTGFAPSSATLVVVVAPLAAPTSTNAGFTPASPAFGQTTTFVVIVTSNGQPVTVGGNVSIKEGATVVAGPLTLGSNGQVILTNTTLSVGIHNLTAAYDGAVGFAASSQAFTLTVGPAPAATAVSATFSPAAPASGQTITFTATVTAGGNPVPAGAVSITEGATTVAGPVTLGATGIATLTGTLAAGAHNLTVSYSGATGFLPSTSPLTVTVTGPATAPTTTTATFTPSSPTAGQTITITAMVKSNGAPVTAGGTVTITNGATTVAGPVTLGSNGTATLTNDTLAAGTYTLTVTYSGAAGFTGSSTTVTVTVAPTATSPAQLADGLCAAVQRYIASGDIRDNGVGVSLTKKCEEVQKRIGQGRLKEAATKLQSFIAEVQALSGKQVTPAAANDLLAKARALLALLPAPGDSECDHAGDQHDDGRSRVSQDGRDDSGCGEDDHNGDCNRSRTSSDGVARVADDRCAPKATTTTATFSPSNPTAGQTVTFTATVKSNGSPVTAGQVSVSEGDTTIAGQVSVNSNGQATLSTSSLSIGRHTLVVKYAGASTLATSSATITVTVLPSATLQKLLDAWCGVIEKHAQGDGFKDDGYRKGHQQGCSEVRDHIGKGKLKDAADKLKDLSDDLQGQAGKKVTSSAANDILEKARSLRDGCK